MTARAALIALTLLVTLPPASAPETHARGLSAGSAPHFPPEGTPGPRDWTVASTEVVANETLVVCGNITVGSGGCLRLENAALLFNCTSPGEFGLLVKSGGELIAHNSRLDSASGNSYGLRALYGSSVVLSNSTISRAGTCSTEPELSGPVIETSSALLENSTFSFSAAGLCIVGAPLSVRDCTFTANVVGLVASAGSCSLVRCSLEGNTGAAVLLLNSSRLETLDCGLNPIDVTVADSSSALKLAWSLDARVIFDNQTPAAGAILSVRPFDGPEELYQADELGEVRGARVLSHTVLNRGVRYHGPFNISANSGGHKSWLVRDVSEPLNITILIDVTPPLVFIDFPENGTWLNATQITVRGRALDRLERTGEAGVALVEVSLDGGDWAPAEGTREWSLRLENLREGDHMLEVRAWDLWRNMGRAVALFTIDLTPPSLDVWPPPGHLTSSLNVTVRITSDGQSLFFNGARLEAFEPNTPLELVWSLESEGENRALVEAVDGVGNSARSELLVVRDTLPPTIRILSPAPFSEHAEVVIPVEGECSDPHGVALVEVSADRRNWTRCEGNESWRTLVALMEGTAKVYIRARDTLGNQAETSLVVFIRRPDLSPPVIEVLYPTNGSALGLSQVTVIGRARDPSGVSSVQLSLDGAVWVAAEGAESWSCALNLSIGWNIIRVRAADRAGNTAALELWVLYEPPPPDTTPPELEILNPSPGLRVGEGRVVVSGIVRDPSGIECVEVSRSGRGWKRCVLTGEVWSGTVALAPGNNTIVVRAFDRCGNRATASTYVFLATDEGRALDLVPIASLLAAIGMTALGLWLAWRAYGGRGTPSGRGYDGTDSEEE
ncbi:MAG: Ig-like domain-containing protein [Thermoplasmata archaeon]